MEKVIFGIKIILKLVFFGFYYFWILSALNFFLFPKNYMSSSEACAAGWKTIGYPIITVILTFLYLLIILIYSKCFKTKNKTIYFKLIIYPLITAGILFWVFGIFFSFLRK
ncbi:hypothetical protein [Flavobacterium eburneipallidum]|uniref:hypothetical protein n=1 Tax=Flavobacterium eburneipallidum TaxID=3003263 RepID=UPI002482E35E|nr:hypothetical protein [Flavobacterium eburneipallidum]